MWRQLTHPLLGLTIAMALATATAGQAPRKGQYLRTATELRARSAAEIERIEAMVTDIRQTRPEHRAVSDLMLRLTDGGAIDTALQTANAAPETRAPPLFRADLYAVVGGRIVKDAQATCGRWVDDVAVCRMDCEGGAFALRRRGRGALMMIVGELPRGISDAQRPRLVLNACAAGEQSELALAPRHGRPFVEIALGEE
jgi:hypothetical protein